MSNDEFDKELDKLRVEQRRLKRQVGNYNKVSEKIRQLERKQKLSRLIGQPGAVRHAIRFPDGTKGSELNDKAGTLLEIHRTRCVVKFDETKWDLSLAEIQPVTEPQGFTVPIG